MAGSTKGDKASSGSSTRKKPKKKRQQVKRHFKPSLGKWVETYDRRGEHARKKERKALEQALASEHAEATPPDELVSEAEGAPPLIRRLIIAGILLGGVLVAIGVFRLVDGRPESPTYDILDARRPYVLRIDRTPPTRLATARKPDLDRLVFETVQSVERAVSAQPGRLVVIEFVSPSLSFNSLTEADQIVLESEYGARAADAYESSVADFVYRVLSTVDSPHVSVLGLPVEAGAAGEQAAMQTNRRYRRVLRRMDQLVSAHIFFRKDSTLDEDQMVREAITEALRRREGRPVVFRFNTEWRVLVNQGALDASEPGRWRTLVAGNVER